MNIFKKLLEPFTNKGRGHQPDIYLLSTLIILITLGLIVLSSASAVIAFQNFNNSYFFLKNQIINGLLVGLVLFFIMLKIDYHQWKRWSFWLFALTVFFLVLVFIPGLGQTYGGSTRWINIFGFNFQPSEISKLTFLIYLASWLEKRGERGVRDFRQGFLPFLFIFLIMMFLIFLQPDLGTMIIIALIGVVIYYVAGASYKHLGGLISVGVFLLVLVILLAPYRLARLTAFINPQVDPLGISYHINQAKIAIGSGGILGLGLGHSRQKYNYLPEVTGDSIFAILAEELGLIFSIFLIILFLTILVRGFKIAKTSSDRYGQLLAAGITSWLCFQAFINIATMVALVPLTGIPLPFVSYGGTALAVILAGCGLLLNISKFTKQSY